MTAHVPAAALEVYARGRPGADDAATWVVEVHLEGCAECRARLAGFAAPPVRELLDNARETIMHRARTGPGPARRSRWRRWTWRWTDWSLPAWAATTSIAVLVAFLLDSAYPHRPSTVLLLAPVAPLTGLVVAWSRHTDPAWEVVAGTARAGLELLLRRTAAILSLALPPLAVAGWLLGTSPALWLLPCLTFTAATLLLGGRIGVTPAAVVLGLGWVAAVAAPALVTARAPALVQPESLPGWAVAATVATVLAALRSDDFRRLASWR
ncbi:zf-HC2 domain-containing protein [Plantactinospora sp. WMMB782]|uniref:zf-HC2 domain-containing protein n=1 Tax=Plantactinospora sp. WMMB782 TaxID=3404121 RepID=UPI003B938396